jgi:hypothetical protein
VATRRRIVLVATAAAVVLAAGVATWVMLRPHNSDCATVHDMLAYSKSENDRMRTLIPASLDDPQKMVDAYQQREARMHHYADQIHDAGLREKADAVISLDDHMLEVWRSAIPGSTPSANHTAGDVASQDLRSAYASYGPQRQQAAETLQAACPSSS